MRAKQSARSACSVLSHSTPLNLHNEIKHRLYFLLLFGGFRDHFVRFRGRLFIVLKTDLVPSIYVVIVPWPHLTQRKRWISGPIVSHRLLFLSCTAAPT